MTVSSTGGAAENVPHCLGVYKRTSQTWAGRPVWQSTVRDDRFLFYHGSIMFLNNLLNVIWTFIGGWLRWVIDDDISNDGAYIQSKNTGLINIPESGWEFNNGTFQEDNTMRVTGKNIYCNEVWDIIFSYRRRTNLSYLFDSIQHRRCSWQRTSLPGCLQENISDLVRQTSVAEYC